MIAREIKREPKKLKKGEGEGKKGNLSFLLSFLFSSSFLPQPLPCPFLAPFFAPSLTLVPFSLLLNRTETLATQATRRLLAIFFASGAASQAENLVPLV